MSITEQDVAAVEAAGGDTSPVSAEGTERTAASKRLGRVTARLTLAAGSVALVGIVTGRCKLGRSDPPGEASSPRS